MDKTTLAPIDKKLAKEFRSIVVKKNNGQIHGKVRPELDRAIRNHVELMKKEIAEGV